MDIGEPLRAGPKTTARPGDFWKQVAGYVLAAACLVWVFHDTHIQRMAEHIGSMTWWWVLPAICCDVLGYVCDGIRWRWLLFPVGRLPVLRATQAIYVGLFTNEVMPMRFGELVRGYLASRWLGRPFMEVVPSMLVCRLMDGVWTAAGIGLVAIFVPLPGDLLLAGDIFGAVVLLLAGALLFLFLREPEVVERWMETPASKRGVLASLRRGVGATARRLRAIGEWRRLAVAGVASLGFLFFEILAFWFIMEAYRLRLPLSAGAAVFLILRLGTALPNAPANVGSYQFFTVLGLSLFGIEKTRATGFSVVVFILLTLPLWALGLLALSRSGLTLAKLREEVRTLVRSGAGPGLAG